MIPTHPNKSLIVRCLQKILPAASVLHETEDLRPYECDGLSAYQQLPLAVVLPETVDQIDQILTFCTKQQIPVVARGAGTGLSGGALPLENGILVSLAKFNRILHIDIENRTAVVQPGVRNLAISDAVREYGLYYAPDPSSQIACSIGGNVAENAGGVHCLKYGLTVHNIMKLEVVTIDGEHLTIGSDALDSPGYDLLALMTGSEGLLGIITEITVKLLPTPETANVILASFDDVATAGQAVSNVIADGILPAGLELMDNAAVGAADDFVNAGYPRDAAAILLCEIDGSDTEVADQLSRAQQLLQRSGATEIRVAKDEQQRAKFWAGRKAAFPAVGRLSPDYYCMDGTIPRHQLADVLTRISELSDEYGLPIVNVFHAGDGNLHPLILYDANIEGELERTEELGGKILEVCVEAGGTITGEHGVGMEKINQMCVQFNEYELQQFHAVKQAFDPNGLLNPGKGIPTLHRCAEFGAMHVHHGQLPHPELERF
ncbi:MAG: glycolate oxidase subunit GlcD [Gammaproteobacteria bacterium]|nr:glycolate oxidase subunit GlcD [Gammaproteobacteria bacterium]NNJ98470.1 glycolate oxidase subunit GlcD [Gammaproteobacteria bacterium]